MLLADHIANAYGGNKSAFARAYGTSHRQVVRWVNAGCLWHDGKVWVKARGPL
mgnify:CR=1 FL=1